MNRKKIVRLELVALVAVVFLLLYRVMAGSPRPEGVVVFDDIEPERVKHAALELMQPDTVVVEATGSFEREEGGDLAAYGWIMRREDRHVVWRMEAPRPERGLLVTVQDTVALPAGRYDTYFTSFGNRQGDGHLGSLLGRLTGAGGAWKNDSRDWTFAVRPLRPGRDAVRQAAEEDPAARAPQGEGRLWTTAPMRGGRSAAYLFQVQQPARVRLYAIGELEPGNPMDYGWIERAATGTRVWEMTMENTEPAGGWAVNRRFAGEVELAPGIYRAVFETDPRQSFGEWVANPPYDPAGWGLTLFTDAAEAVTAFDPWTDRTPLVRMMQVGNSEHRRARLEVTRPVPLVAYAVGEIGGSAYDYAWLTNEATGETVWEMSRDASQEAGGDDNNRVETAFLSLDPGTYTLHYETDGSHAYGDWQNGTPEHPDRWGVALFPLAATVDTSVVRVLEASRVDKGEAAEAPVPPDMNAAMPPPPPALGTGVNLLQHNRLGNEQNVDVPFELHESTALHIYAVGEISLSGRYDYGWIERSDTGEAVWEMTWQNTTPAGGDDRNRRFDGVVNLPAGKYVVRFRTDFSHAFGAYVAPAPADPGAWGITIEKL